MKKILISLLIAIGSCYLINCGEQVVHQENLKPHTKIVVDELGNRVSVPSNPTRIVSLAPNITEMLFALNLGKEVVGVTTYCNYPAAVANIAKVGDTLKPNLEKIISLQPDLVLISTASQLEQFSAKLAQAGIPIFVLKSQSVESILDSLETIGEVTNHRVEAQALVTKMRARINAIKQNVVNKPHPKVFFVVGTAPLITAGKDAFITDLISLAGGVSISADTVSEWPPYSIETVITRAPDIILLPGSEHSEEETTMTLPSELDVTPAKRTGQVYSINGDLILRPGPRIVDGLEKMARLFHPEMVP